MRACNSHDDATNTILDMHLRPEASKGFPAHVGNDKKVYSQKIEDRTLYIGVPRTDPVVALLDRAIDAHANFLQKVHRIDNFLQNNPFSTTPVDLLVSKTDTVALERYAAHMNTRNRDGACALAVCIPMIDSKYVTFVNTLCVSLSRALRYRDYLITLEYRHFKDEASHSEHVQRSLEGMYAVLDDTLHLCAILQTRRVVHDAYRHIWSSHLLIVARVLAYATSKCRDLLEGKKYPGLAFLLCAFINAVGEYVLHSHRKYGTVDESVLVSHLQRLNAEFDNANHVYEQSMDKSTKKNCHWTAFAALSRKASKLSVINADWIKTMNDLSNEVYTSIQAMKRL
ncbi:hypothetical protein CYMTET_55227 [Cymbomonas tetramitiformis]|uniref:Uncharacterized protein n=1 Tax=Cymbomonas tetramitiformis TaxID=36881 RepID=A0AAE0BDZ3_9CHLO|nr:hypothetical protein CYMTET_55227 [Cymbomonas tetramitiformis]|eukprot:gene72-104_t